MIRETPKDQPPTALTISGSDSSGGAGIQADLKTFAALGVHGMSVVTTLTAQNTQRILAVYDVPPTMIKSQLDAVFEDIRVDAVKIGMLHTVETIDIVTQEVKNRTIPIVVDPVMTAKSGRTLLQREALGAFINQILPVTTVLTPNAPEAHRLSGVKVDDLEDAKEAAVKLAECGPRAVIIKGGHLPHTDGVVDVLYTDGEFEFFRSDFIESPTTHGTGCSFASAVAAGLAKHLSVRDAVGIAKDLVTKAIRFGFPIGKGHGPVNPTAWLQNEADRYTTWKNVVDATRLLESEPKVVHLVPEVQINLVMATPHATSLQDVVGIPGRITRRRTRVRASSCPEFGVSRHVARTILTAQAKDSSIRAGMNIRYSPEIIQLCTKLGFQVAFYDRRQEPESLKAVEGETIPWGTKSAIESVEGVPDIIYHLGDWGKEAMITILATSAVDAVQKALRIAKKLEVISQ